MALLLQEVVGFLFCFYFHTVDLSGIVFLPDHMLQTALTHLSPVSFLNVLPEEMSSLHLHGLWVEIGIFGIN